MRKYVVSAVKLENRGAKKTQTFLISIVTWRKCAMWYKIADVTIKPASRKQSILFYCYSADVSILYTNLRVTSRLHNVIYGDIITWIYCTTDDTTQRIPGSIIEPVMKIIESLFREESRCAIIKIGIELVNNAFKSQDGKQPRAKCWNIITHDIKHEQ